MITLEDLVFCNDGKYIEVYFQGFNFLGDLFRDGDGTWNVDTSFYGGLDYGRTKFTSLPEALDWIVKEVNRKIVNTTANRALFGKDFLLAQTFK